MSTPDEAGQLDQKESPSTQRLQLVMSSHSADRLDELKEITEAASYGELVRRALQFLDRLQERSFTIQKEVFVEESKKRNTRIQIVVSQKTRDRLEKLTKAQGEDATYSDVIKLALNYYAKAIDESKEGKPLKLSRRGENIEYDLSLAF